MLKRLGWSTVTALVAFPLLVSPATSEVESACFIKTANGQVIQLDRLCTNKSSAPPAAIPFTILSNQNTLIAQSSQDKRVTVYEDCPSGISSRVAPSAVCESASFINSREVQVYNQTRRFWRTVEFYNVDRDGIVASRHYETVICSDEPSERKIGATQVIQYDSRGAIIGSTESLNLVSFAEQTEEQQNIIRFVCNIR